MTEKELLEKLHNLKTIAPRADWKASSREILLSQIYSGRAEADRRLEEEAFQPAFSYFKNLLSQPAHLVSLLLLFVLGGSALSVSFSSSSKPGDSLYIAKKISEEAQLAFAFNEKAKTNLNIDFAHERAKEISSLMAVFGAGNEDRAKELADNLKSDIKAIKIRLAKMAPAEEDALVSSANSGRSDSGLEIYDPGAEALSSGEAATTTPEEEQPTDGSLETVIGEAKDLFNKEDYAGAILKLDQAALLISSEESKE